MNINVILAQIYGLIEVDDINTCIHNTYCHSKDYFGKSIILYRDAYDIYENDYNEWNPVNNSDQLNLIIEKMNLQVELSEKTLDNKGICDFIIQKLGEYNDHLASTN